MLLYFVQAMLLEAAHARFSGENPSLLKAFHLAGPRAFKIFSLAVIASIVSVVAQAAREKGMSGALGSSIIGLSWSIASYFSLPVLLYENIGVFQSFRRSAQLFKETWGESIASNVSLLLVYLPAAILFLLTFFSLSEPYFLVIASLFLVSLLAGAIVSSVAKAVIAQALYEYASTGRVPQAMPKGAIEGFYSRTVG
jgi:hypothetical protein